MHYVDFGGNPDGPAVVLVHGLGGSHLNWDLLAPLLTGAARVVRARPARASAAASRASAPAAFRPTWRCSPGSWSEEVGEPVVLVGNSMGGMISILLTGERPDLVSGLVLLDPAIPGPRRALDPLVALTFALYAVPLVGERVHAPQPHPPVGHRPRLPDAAAVRRRSRRVPPATSSTGR